MVVCNIVRGAVVRWRFVGVMIAALVVAGCDGSEPSVPTDSGPEASADAEADTDSEPQACARAVVTTGLGLRWENLNHRISWWKMQPAWDGCPARLPGDATLHAAFIGGSYTTGEMLADTPSYAYDYQIVHAPDGVGFHAGSIRFELLPPSHQAESTETVALEETHLLGFDEYVVLIQGVELDTRVEQGPDYPEHYNPAHGYTNRGIGAWADAPQVSGGTLSFEAGLRFAHGPSDREDMNEAMGYARCTGSVHYLLVAVRGGKVHRVSNSYRLTYPKPEMLVDQVIEHATAEQRQVEVSVDPALKTAFVGWSSFNFVLDPDGTVDPEKGEPIGYYIREYAVVAGLARWDPAAGSAVVDMDGYVSNASKFLAFYPLDSFFAGEVVLLQLPTGTVEQSQSGGSFGTGEVTVPLGLGGRSP